jgi:hypothetical protein
MHGSDSRDSQKILDLREKLKKLRTEE